MPALLLAAAPVLESMRVDHRARVAAVRARLGRPPHLSVVLVGEDAASAIYVARKGKAAEAVGMTHETILLPATATAAEARAVVARLGDSDAVDGILIQRPLPRGFAEDEVAYWIPPAKDVDAFHPENVGRLALGLPAFAPCTPAGIIRILAHYGIPIAGRKALVIGRSSIVGKPMASLLLQRDATILHAHSRTPDLKALVGEAEIVVVAVGRAGLLEAADFKPGAVVIDVGMNRLPDGKVVGDVTAAGLAERVSAYTPVPGGVGPMTIATLLDNTIRSAEGRFVG